MSGRNAVQFSDAAALPTYVFHLHVLKQSACKGQSCKPVAELQTSKTPLDKEVSRLADTQNVWKLKNSAGSLTAIATYIMR